ASTCKSIASLTARSSIFLKAASLIVPSSRSLRASFKKSGRSRLPITSERYSGIDHLLGLLRLVSPVIIVLAYVAHLYLERVVVSRRVRQHASLEGLDQDVLHGASHAYRRPIWLADGEAAGVEPRRD